MSEESVDTALLDLDTEVLREVFDATGGGGDGCRRCLLYTSPSPRD